MFIYPKSSVYKAFVVAYLDDFQSKVLSRLIYYYFFLKGAQLTIQFHVSGTKGF